MTLLYEQPSAEILTPEQQLERDIALVLQTALEHHHKGEFDDAQALYRAILDAKPNHADVMYNLGVLLGQVGQAADALPLFEQCLGLQPHNGQYWAAYISGLIDAGETAAAWLALEMGQKQGLKGPAVDGLIVRMANPGLTVQTVPVATEKPQSPEAEPPQETPAAKTSIAAGRRISQQETSRFTSLYNKGNIAEAVKLGESLTQRFPADGNSWRWLGIALHRQGRYDDALPPLRKAAELNPEELETRTVLADTLRLKNMLAEAERECRAIVAINADSAEAQRILGIALVHQGQVAEGLAAARRAIEIAPNNASVHSSLSALFRKPRNRFAPLCKKIRKTRLRRTTICSHSRTTRRSTTTRCSPSTPVSRVNMKTLCARNGQTMRTSVRRIAS